MTKNTIKLENLSFFGYHGINQDEIKNGQDFVLDLIVRYTSTNNKDNIENFIDYTDLYNLVKNSFEEKRFNLLESLGNKILNDIRQTYESVFYVRANMRKPSISIDNNKNFINVEVEYKKWEF